MSSVTTTVSLNMNLEQLKIKNPLSVDFFLLMSFLETGETRSALSQIYGNESWLEHKDNLI